MGALIAVLIVAAVIATIGTVVSGIRLARRWRSEPPPKYSKPYHRWDDEE
jgi:hypothetical protein